ncbi:AraC family transcriptional regulator [Reticulibacter mediterranei]|uniref:AraC family transcriptional regulator n=1 Tax=Reticulibacter mediterranei TaxID=2778369 RepID=A0A8J3IPH6_9CHLR|nr:helix-turn-helix domain-containing protein [Reticulibacter mediterranei]GHO94545.1 AraC family transcriptional regulator [Reticulibacter mediterranei]
MSQLFPSIGPEDVEQRTRNVVFFLLPNINLLDLAGPSQVFDTAARLGAPYRLAFCSTRSTQTAIQGLVLAQLAPLPSVTANDLVMIPGISGVDVLSRAHPLLDEETREWLCAAYAAGALIASVCTGAFALGEAGLLDGRRCTTHWLVESVLQERNPRAQVQGAVLFVHDRGITTSAGVASGIDMALSLLERQLGPIFAAQVARMMVVYMRRNGTHSQSSVYLDYRTHLHSEVHRAQDHLVQHVAECVSLKELAEVAGVSTRSLNRVFKEATGLTPVQYHQQLRLELAATLLSNLELTIEEVATKCGFEDVRHFRRLWLRQFGMPPSASRLTQCPNMPPESRRWLSELASV